MRIYLRQIGAQGYEANFVIAAEDIGLTPDDYLHFVSPVAITAHLSRAGETVLSDTLVRGRYAGLCFRTNVNVERDWSARFLVDFPVQSTTEFIDIKEDIRQEIITHLPLRILADGVVETPDDEVVYSDEGRAGQSASSTKPAPSADTWSEGETYRPFEHLKAPNETRKDRDSDGSS